MTIKIFTDRSRIVERERCDRKRWLVYHESGTGIVPKRTPLALAVGSSGHVGLAELLMFFLLNPEKVEDFINGLIPAQMAALEETAVRAALADFSSHAAGLELDANENAGLQGQTSEAKQLAEQMIAQARELGMAESDIAGITAGVDPAVARSEFERYLFTEQSALVEGLVRAYARRRLLPLLSEFEVLEVEREGEWKLGTYGCEYCGSTGTTRITMADGPLPCNYCGGAGETELWFMSRPDALLRHRQTNELYLLSYKTTGQWDVRKAKDIEHDMQGLSEGVEVEKRLADWWTDIHHAGTNAEAFSKLYASLKAAPPSKEMYNFLSGLSAPPRIHAIRYEFLLKGERWKDRELSARLGVDARSQKSHLIYQYVAQSTPKSGKNQEAFRVGDICWAWEFIRPEDQTASKLYAGNWRPRAVWEGEGVKSWIDKLDRSEVLMSGEDSTIGLAPRALGYRSEAQAMGVTESHPLDAAFVPPVTVWRNDDDLRDWIDTVAHEEQETAQRVAEVNAAGDPGERRHLLNIYFPKRRSSCQYPSECPYAREKTGVCFAGAEMQAAPLEVGGGEYVRRVANHPQELAQITKPIP